MQKIPLTPLKHSFMWALSKLNQLLCRYLFRLIYMLTLACLSPAPASKQTSLRIDFYYIKINNNATSFLLFPKSLSTFREPCICFARPPQAPGRAFRSMHLYGKNLNPQALKMCLTSPKKNLTLLMNSRSSNCLNYLTSLNCLSSQTYCCPCFRSLILCSRCSAETDRNRSCFQSFPSSLSFRSS